MRRLFILLLGLAVSGCFHTPSPGPDKQFSKLLSGAITGAGTGAVAGFHLTSATGPGAFVGAGFGAVAGGMHGFVFDLQEEAQMALERQTRRERQVAYAHRLLAEHFRRRIELHPTRDIFPADYFFEADSATLRNSAKVLVDELAWLNKNRYPWSRLVIATYVKSKDADSQYAQHLALERSKELGDYFIRSGIEPRRITTRAVIVDEPLLLDPVDNRDRYAQAIELIPLDR